MILFLVHQFPVVMMRANLQRHPQPHSKKTLQQCVRLSRSTLASAVCSAATPAGSSTASCVSALSNPPRATLVRARVGPPGLRAQNAPPRIQCSRKTRPPRARASRRPLATPLYTSISQPPQPARLRVPASFPSCRIVSHLSHAPPPSTGARHPARRPDALGQDDWRRR